MGRGGVESAAKQRGGLRKGKEPCNPAAFAVHSTLSSALLLPSSPTRLLTHPPSHALFRCADAAQGGANAQVGHPADHHRRCGGPAGVRGWGFGVGVGWVGAVRQPCLRSLVQWRASRFWGPAGALVPSRYDVAASPMSHESSVPAWVLFLTATRGLHPCAYGAAPGARPCPLAPSCAGRCQAGAEAPGGQPQRAQRAQCARRAGRAQLCAPRRGRVPGGGCAGPGAPGVATSEHLSGGYLRGRVPLGGLRVTCALAMLPVPLLKKRRLGSSRALLPQSHCDFGARAAHANAARATSGAAGRGALVRCVIENVRPAPKRPLSHACWVAAAALEMAAWRQRDGCPAAATCTYPYTVLAAACVGLDGCRVPSLCILDSNALSLPPPFPLLRIRRSALAPAAPAGLLPLCRARSSLLLHLPAAAPVGLTYGTMMWLLRAFSLPCFASRRSPAPLVRAGCCNRGIHLVPEQSFAGRQAEVEVPAQAQRPWWCCGTRGTSWMPWLFLGGCSPGWAAALRSTGSWRGVARMRAMWSERLARQC